MVWILIALPLVTLVMVLVLAFVRGPSFPVHLDPPALRTTARVMCVDLESADMLDVLAVALQRCGYEDVRTTYDRDGYTTVGTHAASGKRRTLSPVVIAPSMQLFTGLRVDDAETRDFMRALHEALRADTRVRSVRWVKFEHHNAVPDRSESTPFDGF
jgi:hypothetical protein